MCVAGLDLSNRDCLFLGIDYEDKEYIITLGNDNMIYVETLLPGQKNQVTPLFPEPLASYFLDLKYHIIVNQLNYNYSVKQKLSQILQRVGIHHKFYV